MPLVTERGTEAMASSELLRYSAEAVFLPTVLLPRGAIFIDSSERAQRTSRAAGRIDDGFHEFAPT